MNHTESTSSIKRLLLLGLFSSALFYLIFFGNVIIHRARSSMKKIKKLHHQQQFSQYELAKSYEESLLNILSQIKEERFFSENSEDGVILSLLKIFNISSQHGFYVEIGANNGQSCNTRNLREKLEWKGLLFDEFHKNSQLNLHRERVTHANVLSLLSLNHVAKESIDLLSVDTNNADYWLIEQILSAGYKPKILIHEVNKETPRHCVTVPKPAPNDKGDWLHKTRFYGASVCAFTCLAKHFNYTMIYCESSGENCFWVRNDYFKMNKNGLDHSFVQAYLKPRKLFRKPPETTTKNYNINKVYTIEKSENFLDKMDKWIKIRC